MVKKGSRIKVDGSSLEGTVMECLESGNARVLLDGGACVELPLMILDEVSQMTVPSGTKQQSERNADGTFAQGHEPYGANPEYKAEKENARKLQRELLEGFAPLLRKAPLMVEKIAKPEMKIASMAKLMPFFMPSLSRVEYNESAPRNISVEMRLVEFKKEQEKKMAEEKKKEEEIMESQTNKI